MYGILTVWLYAFVVLAIICKLAGIEQFAYAQMWDFAPGVQIQSQSTNNLQLNKNVLQPNDNNNNVNNKNSIESNCITTESNIVSGTVASRLTSGLVSSPSKTSSNCAPPLNYHHYPHTCRDLIVKNNIKFRVPPAETIKNNNIIKAVSTPPIDVPIIGGAVDDTTPSGVQETPSDVQEICGTNLDDYIIGSEGDDIIFGLRGNDIITALGEDDIVFAGPGDDIVYGGDGNNQLFGEDGNDNLVGGTQDDLIIAGLGNDRLYGNSGDDILQGQDGADYFDCGDDLDTVVDYTPTQGDVISVNCENVNLVH